MYTESACGERDKDIWFVLGSIAYHYNCPPCDRYAALRLKRTDTKLLAALKALLESIESVDFSSPVQIDGLYDQIPWAQAEAAIAKAEEA
jgi:hypothetical protein